MVRIQVRRGASFEDWRIASVLWAKWSRSSSADRGHSRGDCGDKIELKAFQSALPSFSASSIYCRRKEERFCWNSFLCFRDCNFRRFSRTVSVGECLSFRSRWRVLRFEVEQSASNHLHSGLCRIVYFMEGNMNVQKFFQCVVVEGENRFCSWCC